MGNECETVVMQCVAKLKSRLSKAVEIATQHGTLVRPDVYTLAVEVLDEVVDEMCQKTGRTEGEVLRSLQKEFDEIRRTAEVLLATVTIALITLSGEKHADRAVS